MYWLKSGTKEDNQQGVERKENTTEVKALFEESKLENGGNFTDSSNVKAMVFWEKAKSLAFVGSRVPTYS